MDSLQEFVTAKIFFDISIVPLPMLNACITENW